MYIPSDPFTEVFLVFSGIAFVFTILWIIKLPEEVLSYMFWPFDKGMETLFVTPVLWLFFLATVNVFVGLFTGDLLTFFKQ